MIHQILTLQRPLIVFDTETTGTDSKNDRILELGFQLWTSEGLQKEFRTLVNPCVPISPEVTEIHGISEKDFITCRTCNRLRAEHDPTLCPQFYTWPTFAQLAPSLAKGFTGVDWAGKNVRFDLQITASEMKRAGQPWSYAGARIVDIDRLEAWLNKRSLSHLHRKYVRVTCIRCLGRGHNLLSEDLESILLTRGSLALTNDEKCQECNGAGSVGQKLEGAHGALTDVQGSTRVLCHQFDALTQNEDEAVPLPRDLDELHHLQWPGWIDSEGLFAFVKGIPCFGRWGKHAGRPMNHPDVLAKVRGTDYYDFIISSDFSDEAKAIAREAKAGRFPVEAK